MAPSPLTVDSSCFSTTLFYPENPAAGDTAWFYASYSGVTAVYWDFGDPASGINNYSTSPTPTHIFSTPGTYIGSLIYTDGINSDTLPVVTYVIDNTVWPGDANRDGYVNGEDMLAIGLYHGKTGGIRPGASNAFVSQPSPDWNTTGFSLMYLQDMVDFKHADCNGDGVVDTNDVSVVAQNFGMVHLPHNWLSDMSHGNSSAPYLTLQLPAVVPAGAVVASINLGDSLLPASIYGVSLVLQYDPLQIDASTIGVDFSGTWLNPSPLINWFYNDVANSRLYIVSARTNQTGQTGYGMLAHINFNTALGYTGPLSLVIDRNSKVMSNSVMNPGTFGNVENFISVRMQDGQSTITTGISEPAAINSIRIYPSPATEFITIEMATQSGKGTLRIYDATGKLVEEKLPEGLRTSLDVRSLEAGLYFVEVRGEGAISASRFTKLQ